MLPLALSLSYLISYVLLLPQPITQIWLQNIMQLLKEVKINENKKVLKIENGDKLIL